MSQEGDSNDTDKEERAKPLPSSAYASKLEFISSSTSQQDGQFQGNLISCHADLNEFKQQVQPEYQLKYHQTAGPPPTKKRPPNMQSIHSLRSKEDSSQNMLTIIQEEDNSVSYRTYASRVMTNTLNTNGTLPACSE